MSFVPNAGNAFIDPPKLTYLLQKNAGKAKFFALFGFDPGRPQELESALKWHVTQRHYDSICHSAHGTRHKVRGQMLGADS